MFYVCLSFCSQGGGRQTPYSVRQTPLPPPTPQDSHCSERYASYLNALLFCFNISSTFPHSEFPDFAPKCQIPQVGKPYFIVPDFTGFPVSERTQTRVHINYNVTAIGTKMKW